MPYPSLLHPESLSLWQSTDDPHLYRRCSNTVLSQSLWGPWVLVCTRFVWVFWASLAGMGSYWCFSDIGHCCLSNEMETTEVLSRRVTCSDFCFLKNSADHSAEILLYYSSSEGGSRKTSCKTVIIISVRELLVSWTRVISRKWVRNDWIWMYGCSIL